MKSLGCNTGVALAYHGHVNDQRLDSVNDTSACRSLELCGIFCLRIFKGTVSLDVQLHGTVPPSLGPISRSNQPQARGQHYKIL